MNARPLENILMTQEEYLEFEKDSEIRHEYFGGEIFAMTGAGLSHNQINHNISGELRNRLKESHCSSFSSDMRIKIEVIDNVGLIVKIESIDCELPLSEVYYRVDFDENE